MKDIVKKFRMEYEDVAKFDEYCQDLQLTYKEALHNLIKSTRFMLNNDIPQSNWVGFRAIPFTNWQFLLRTCNDLEGYQNLVHDEIIIMEGRKTSDGIPMFDSWKDIFKEWSMFNSATLTDVDGVIVWNHGICKELSQVFGCVWTQLLKRDGFDIVWSEFGENQCTMKYLPTP